MAQALPKVQEISPICSACNYKASNEEDFIKHSSIHQYNRNFFIECVNCHQCFKRVDNYKRHKEPCLKNLKDDNGTLGPILPERRHFWLCKSVNCNEKLEISDEPNIKDFEAVTTHLSWHVRVEERKVICPIVLCGIAYYNYRLIIFRNSFLLTFLSENLIGNCALN
jgi:hypothetical protein